MAHSAFGTQSCLSGKCKPSIALCHAGQQCGADPRPLSWNPGKQEERTTSWAQVQSSPVFFHEGTRKTEPKWGFPWGKGGNHEATRYSKYRGLERELPSGVRVSKKADWRGPKGVEEKENEGEREEGGRFKYVVLQRARLRMTEGWSDWVWLHCALWWVSKKAQEAAEQLI